jgi:DNA uptake protein ComE-like DNA-binding protein
MRMKRAAVPLIVGALAFLAPAALDAQEVAKRAAKRGAKEATESAAREATEEAAKKAVKKSMAPDAVDLNSASEEQLKKLGLDEATVTKVTAARPFENLDDPKVKEAIPADVLTKLEGKIDVKPKAK